MRAVLPGRLFVGGVRDAEDSEALRAAGIGRLLSLGARPSRSPDHHGSGGIEVLDAMDEAHEVLLRWAPAAFAALRAPPRPGHGPAILVHCVQGQSRSVGTLALALIVRAGASEAEALQLVDGGGSAGAGVNSGFLLQLSLAAAMRRHVHREAEATAKHAAEGAAASSSASDGRAARLPPTCRAHSHTALLQDAAAAGRADAPLVGFGAEGKLGRAFLLPFSRFAAAPRLSGERKACLVAAVESSVLGSAPVLLRADADSTLPTRPWGVWVCIACGEQLALDQDVCLPLDARGFPVPEAASTPVCRPGGAGVVPKGAEEAPDLAEVAIGAATWEQVASADRDMLTAAAGLPTRCMAWMRAQGERLICPGCGAKVGRAGWASDRWPFVLSASRVRWKGV